MVLTRRQANKKGGKRSPAPSSKKKASSKKANGEPDVQTREEEVDKPIVTPAAVATTKFVLKQGPKKLRLGQSTGASSVDSVESLLFQRYASAVGMGARKRNAGSSEDEGDRGEGDEGDRGEGGEDDEREGDEDGENDSDDGEEEEEKGAGKVHKKSKWTLDSTTSLSKSLYIPSGSEVNEDGKALVLECQYAEDMLAKKGKAVLAEEGKSIGAPPLSKNQKLKQAKTLREKTAGKRWFDLPAPDLTEEERRDLQIVRMRNTIYKDRFFKKDEAALPKYFQVGTVVAGAGEFYSRAPASERRGTFVEEILADSSTRKYTKRKFLEIQHEKSKGIRHSSRKQRRLGGGKKAPGGG